MSDASFVNRDEVIEWVVQAAKQQNAGSPEQRLHVAVVGLSDNPERPSYRVAEAMQKMGYTILPVNPLCEEVLGVGCYPDLASVPAPVEIVQVFRRSDHVPSVVRELLREKERLGVRVLWLQEGVIHEEAARLAHEAGIDVVMDRCLYKEVLRSRS